MSLTVEALADAIASIEHWRTGPDTLAGELLPFIERHIAAGQQGEQSDLLDDLARIYATIPVLPVTAETAEEATNALLAFCYLPAVRKALDLQILPPAPLGDAEDYLRPLRNAIGTADAYATGGPRSLRIVTLRMDEAEAMLARASLTTPQPPKPAGNAIDGLLATARPFLAEELLLKQGYTWSGSGWVAPAPKPAGDPCAVCKGAGSVGGLLRAPSGDPQDDYEGEVACTACDGIGIKPAGAVPLPDDIASMADDEGPLACAELHLRMTTLGCPDVDDGSLADGLRDARRELKAYGDAREAAGRADAVPAVLTGKYGEVLRPFLAMMEHELHANAGKGDRPGWLTMSSETAMLEIYYHVAKLQKAVRHGDVPSIGEYSADVANMAMMVADIFCALITPDSIAPLPQQPAAEGARRQVKCCGGTGVVPNGLDGITDCPVCTSEPEAVNQQMTTQGEAVVTVSLTDDVIEAALDAKLGLDHTLRQLVRGDTLPIGYSKAEVVRALVYALELNTPPTGPQS